MLIGIVGFINSGKGTIGDILEQKGFHKDSFAKPLKDACSVIFGWPREMLEGDTEVSRKWRDEPDPFWSQKFGYKFSPRMALQLMGTEAGREVFHKDIWVVSLLNRAKGRDVVVTDVRFQNEIKYIQNSGGFVIRVKRGEDPDWLEGLSKLTVDYERNGFMSGKDVHISEWDWVGTDFDFEVENNGTIEDLGKKIDEVLQLIRK